VLLAGFRTGNGIPDGKTRFRALLYMNRKPHRPRSRVSSGEDTLEVSEESGGSPDPSPELGPPAQGYSHAPVLLDEVVSYVPAGARLLVDCTAGGGGHAAALLERFPEAELLALDRDPHAVATLQSRLESQGSRVVIRHSTFSRLPSHLMVESADFILADLGVSSPQLDQAARGFSFLSDGPLDMRMDPGSGGPTAADIVNTWPEQELCRLFMDLGEERFSGRIAQALVYSRDQRALRTSGELARVIHQAVPFKFHRRGRHPATKVFQALRIAVNEELEELSKLLESAPGMLRPGGRLAVISFHSLEDRKVKEAFRTWENPCVCPSEIPVCVCGLTPLGRRLTKKAVAPSAAEISTNPRSRSAHLRVFEKRPEAVPEERS